MSELFFRKHERAKISAVLLALPQVLTSRSKHEPLRFDWRQEILLKQGVNVCRALRKEFSSRAKSVQRQKKKNKSQPRSPIPPEFRNKESARHGNIVWETKPLYRRAVRLDSGFFN